MDRGYVKLWRKALDSGLLQNGPAWQLCGYLLLKASHKPRKSIFGGVVCELQAGEAVFGRLKAANDLCLSEQQIRTALNLLKKMEILTTRATNKFTVVSFVNWGKYQDEQPASNQQTNQPATSTQPTPNHIQECKNINTSTDSYESVVDATASTPDQQPENLEAEDKPLESKRPTVPPCPHQQILALYHELLPELPRMKIWDGARQQNLTARWRERWKAGHYATQADGLAYWRRMFVYISSRCDWLMGRSENYGGRKPFQASLDWIVKPQNFAKIIEGKYDRREAA